MPVQVSLDDLVAYTDWQHDYWHVWFQKHGARALAIGVGPHGNGRFQTVGDLVRHVFSTEARYIDRLSGRPLTDSASLRIVRRRRRSGEASSSGGGQDV